MPLIKRAVLATSLVLVGGCSSFPTATDAKKVADAIGTIKPSKADTCETVRQIAEQASRVETIKQGKEVTYKPGQCETKG